MQQPQPNLVYGFPDRLRYRSLSYAGDPRAAMPNIDRLAAQGAASPTRSSVISCSTVDTEAVSYDVKR
jgi:hypothetical protein